MRALGASRTSVVAGGVLAGNWASNPLWKNARAVPSLDLRFAENKSLTDAKTGASLITFTRASSGTYVGSDGLVKTATTNEARFDHNPTTGESLGLLVEEARTNLSLYSEDFSNVYWVKTSCTITSNESTAPDGTLTADLWTNTASPGTIENSITKDLTVRTYTASLWVKGTLTQLTFSLDDGTTGNRGRVQFNLSTNTVGSIFNEGSFSGTSGTLTRFLNGWVRVTVTTTTSTGATLRFRPFFSGVGSVLRVWGGQIEEGAFATSYIPTTTATVTRAADVASITGTNFSSWYNQTEGSYFLDSTQASIGAAQRLFSASDNSVNNRIQLSRGTASGGNIQMGVTTGGSAQVTALAFATSVAAGTSNKVAAVYKSADFAGSVNGLTAVTQGTGTIPGSLTQLTIGNGDILGNTTMTGTIKRLTYWPTRLANPTLQSITAP
jgi:hypothetical protein